MNLLKKKIYNNVEWTWKKACKKILYFSFNFNRNSIQLDNICWEKKGGVAHCFHLNSTCIMKSSSLFHLSKISCNTRSAFRNSTWVFIKYSHQILKWKMLPNCCFIFNIFYNWRCSWRNDHVLQIFWISNGKISFVPITSLW